MTPRLPERISTVLFDVGNTLHHLDHAFIAHTVSRHGKPVTATDVAIAEYAAKAAIDAGFRARAAGSDADRRFSYFEIILNALDVPANAIAAILTELQADDRRESLWRVMEPDTPRVISELRRRGFALAVVSNADGRVSAALHRDRRLAPCGGGEAGGAHLPDRARGVRGAAVGSRLCRRYLRD